MLSLLQHDIKMLEDNPQPEDTSNLLLNVTQNLDNSAAQFLRETVKKNVSLIFI